MGRPLLRVSCGHALRHGDRARKPSQAATGSSGIDAQPGRRNPFSTQLAALALLSLKLAATCT